ncbi:MULTISPECIES: glycoside hydrolase family 2 TIM barrel-domain containing protein [unclassified Ensifer]|uniref:glycoside hydrolase family 2 protein n=1 Tax=unclassified Ensifer TaxID=2633371 RepID=UPI000710A894|nr:MULTISPECIES: glycoside hydrolase family 2 TIM barrel-domain containing protein [unclassified Ensifer]KQW56656.1 beta-D-galactosidase [Ensifer sp. Root1252]KRC75035.1 beta-D-galactosidase [Ensifer sp. Root231]KRC96503.1 beta-D-galactosidase [Ensifer sp. Root258]
MRITENFNANWVFRHGFEPAHVQALQPGETVRLPHSAVELPYNYFDETDYQKPFTYQKRLDWRPEFEGREVSLIFDAAMADSVVYLNGQEIIAHKDGYTPFEARLTPHLTRGENLITVKIDGSENPEIPPFGGQIDYLCYAGIYRDVWLKVTNPVSIANVKIETPDALAEKKSVTARVFLANPQGHTLSGTLSAKIRRRGGGDVAASSIKFDGNEVALAFPDLTDIELWDIDNPVLYALSLKLETEYGEDVLTQRFGFRTALFTPEGFLLNGRPLKLRGLNRHQAFPHTGYAMGRRAQEKDADILKHELACNVVRTSHYPQSKWFIERCDEIGLLVFEEIPGWQHIGGETWQKESIENVRRMIERDWNHPSIIIWGVRINESQDNHAFYAETNRLARELDPTRQTGGVRFITNSELLEDVYTMNDFILGNEELPGNNRGRVVLRDRVETTGIRRPIPYMITEYNGHMYPTKRFDQEQRQAEHVTRHLLILNAVAGDQDISGSTGWCMFDYNTHKDFGAGDRICYHGVLDMYRIPKLAAYAYASQGDPNDNVVLQPVTFWARGERNIGGVLPLIVLTNCDYVEVKFGEWPVKRIYPDRENYPHLPHPPVVLDLRSVTAEEFGTWGRVWCEGTFTGYVDGKAVKTLTLPADPVPATLEVVADDTELRACEKDAVRVVVRALDQCGNLLPYFEEPVLLSLDGPGRIIGPSEHTLKGGATGFWIEAGEAKGKLELTVTSRRFENQSITFTVS